MELRHLRYFVAVAEELNFTRAARSYASISHRWVRKFDNWKRNSGTPLFRRLAKGVELTDAGKLLLEQARIILKQVDDATIGVRRRARGKQDGSSSALAALISIHSSRKSLQKSRRAIQV